MAKVLLVEDDNNLREIYEARLGAEGYEISTAQDGEEALVVAKETKPDLVVSDVMMPKISGFEMLDILRNTPGLEQVKVIMLTALGQTEDRDRADSLGADKYLVKSQVTLEDIVKTAHQLLGDDTAGESTETVGVAPEEVVAPVAPTTPDPVIPEPAATTIVASEPASDDTSQTAIVQPEPVAEPTMPVASPPEPSTVTSEEPIVATPPVTTDTTSDTAVQEQTVTEQQSSDPAQPETESTPEAVEEPVVEAPVIETSTEPTPNNSTPTEDDQILANAITELADSSADTAETAEPETEATTETPEPVEPAPEAPTTPTTEEIVPDPTTETTTEPEEPEAKKVEVAAGGQKVIQPLSGPDESKPDINELLAQEEATNDATPAVEAQPTQVTPGIAHQPGESFAPQPETETPAPVASETGATPAPAQKDGLDPNSVAL